MSTAHHPQTDGQSERCIQQLLSLLRTTTHRLRDDWSLKLSLVEFAFNSTISSVTGTSPFFALHGFNPKDPLSLGIIPPNETEAAHRVKDLQTLHKDIQCLVEKAHLNQKRRADSKRRPHKVKVGDLVKLKTDHLKIPGLNCRKLKDSFVGPFRVIDQKSSVSFTLDLPEELSKKFPAFHVKRLRPYWTSDEWDFNPEPQNDVQPEPEEFQVGSIVDVDLDKEGTTLMFKVRWAPPYEDEVHDSWVPLRNVAEVQALDDFLRTSTWHSFARTRDYRSFRRRFPERTPNP